MIRVEIPNGCSNIWIDDVDKNGSTRNIAMVSLRGWFLHFRIRRFIKQYLKTKKLLSVVNKEINESH